MFPTVSPKDLSDASVQRSHPTAPSAQRLYQTDLSERFRLRICPTVPLNGCIQQLCHQLYATVISDSSVPRSCTRLEFNGSIQRTYPTVSLHSFLQRLFYPMGSFPTALSQRYILISNGFLSQGRVCLLGVAPRLSEAFSHLRRSVLFVLIRH